ncbi:MAG: Abi family protein [Oscillospiraceae bacterium]
MSDKPFKTYNEQIELLKSKQLIIQDENLAKNALNDISYFALINGYKNAFKKNDVYDNAYFEDILSLFQFDEKLRGVLLKNILIVERKIKSSISYHFSCEYPNCQTDYLNVNNYQYNDVKNRDSIIKLVSTIQAISKSRNYAYIKHYTENHHSNVPLWVLINAVSFGKVSKIYAFSQQSIQQKVANDFKDVSNAQLKNMLELLTHFRNVCAHNERLYNYKTRISLKKTKLFEAFNLSKNDDCNLFSVVICMKYLLKEKEFESFFCELESTIQSLSFKGSKIETRIILTEMGFPNNWERIKETDISKAHN